MRPIGDPLFPVVFSPVYTVTPGRKLNGQRPSPEVKSQKQEACRLSSVTLSPGTSWTRKLLFSVMVGLAGRQYVWDPDPWGPIPWGGMKPGPEARRQGQELACMQSSRGGEESQTGGAGLTQSLILMKAIIPATNEDGSAH